MVKWLQRSERVTEVSFRRVFEWASTPGAGFGFDCAADGSLLRDANGTVVDKWSQPWIPAAVANYEMCLRGQDGGGRRIVDRGVEEYTNSNWEPGVIECVCGAEVTLAMSMTNTCAACERDYNGYGQLLAPREQWGEETGESSGDIQGANRSINDRY
jgi:hypothetical protein